MADFVLQENQIIWLSRIQYPVNIFLSQAMVCAAIHNNGVLSRRLNLYNRMTAGLLHPHQNGKIGACLFQYIHQKIAVRPNSTRMNHLPAGTRSRHGLVQPLSACKSMHRRGADGFSRLHRMRHIIYPVNVQRAKVDDLQGVQPPVFIREFD